MFSGFSDCLDLLVPLSCRFAAFVNGLTIVMRRSFEFVTYLVNVSVDA